MTIEALQLAFNSGILSDGVSRPIFRSSGASMTNTDVTNSRSSAHAYWMEEWTRAQAKCVYYSHTIRPKSMPTLVHTLLRRLIAGQSQKGFVSSQCSKLPHLEAAPAVPRPFRWTYPGEVKLDSRHQSHHAPENTFSYKNQVIKKPFDNLT